MTNANKTTERIFKSGNSQALSLSKESTRLIGLRIGDKVEIEEINGGLFITKKKSSIKDRIKNFYQNGGKYTESEIDFGESVGREL